MKSTFLDMRGPTSERPITSAASADGGGYSATDISYGLQLAKYDSTGAVQWQQRLGLEDAGYFHLQETSTGVYVSGCLRRFKVDGQQTFLAKYDLAGNRQFIQFIGQSYPTYKPLQMIVDANENVFLLVSTGTVYDKFLLKCDRKGVVIWQRRIGTYNQPAIDRMHRDTAGNFYIAGSAGRNAFVIKIDPNGNTLWQYSYGEPGTDRAFFGYDAIPGPDGSVYANFVYSDPTQTPSAGTQIHKLNSAGVRLWSTTISETANSVEAVDSVGNCFASATDTYYPSTAKVSPNGAILWNKPFITVDDSASDSAGNLTLLNRYGAVVKVDPNGNTLWSLSIPAIPEFSMGDVMMSGQQVDDAGNPDYATVVTRRVNSSKTILWTSAGLTNDHRDEYWNGSRMPGGVTANGTVIFSSKHRFVGIDSAGATVFNIADGYNPNESETGEIMPTRDGGFITHPVSYKAQKFGPTGVFQWESGYELRSEDSAGNFYAQTPAGTSAHQVAVLKVNSAGTLVWWTLLPSVSPTVAYAGAPYVDSAGEVFAQFNGELWKLSSSGGIVWHVPLPVDDEDKPVQGRLLWSDEAGNLYMISSRNPYTTHDTFITKYTPNGTKQFDNSLRTGDWSTVLSTALYKGRIYAVGSTRTGATSTMVVFCIDAQTGSVAWISTPNPGLSSGASAVFVDETLDELRIAGERYTDGEAADYALVGMDLNGQVTRVSTYDSGFAVNDHPRVFGMDAQHNFYIAGQAMGPSDTYDYNVVKFTLPPPDWASIEIPSVVTKMAAGTSYSGTVKVTNTGLNTWTAATGYKLDCVQSSTWSLTSVPLASGDSIAPGQSKVFSFTVTAPATPGAYPLTFKMEHSGVQFDNASASLGIQVMTQTNFAQFVGQTVPTAMVAGQSYAVSVQYKNTGSNTWTPGNGYKLQSVNPLNNTRWGVNRLALTTSSVPPGGTGTFSGTVIAPMTSGTYNFQWQPIQDTTGLAFGSPSTNVAVTVTNAGDAARYVSKTGPLTVNAGTDFYVQDTMLNVGSNAWSTAAGYSLRAIFNNWGAMNIFLPGSVSSVAPGAQVTFTKLLTAPLTPGTYPMQWQMLHGSTLFGDKTPYLNISVVQGPYNAKFNSQSVLSTSVAAGTTFGCTFSMQNLGTSTWDSTVKLASVGSSFGVPSIPVTGTVIQNANSSFSATFTAPATPGTYTFQFRMQSPAGTYFGQPSTPVTIVVTPADAAQFISKTGPLTVNAGSDFYVQNTFKNTGTSTWSSASGFNLRSINPLDNLTWGRNRIYLPGTGSVAPGGSVTLTGLCTAPSQPGTYTMQWQMNHGTTLFGEKTPALTINVVQGADNAVFLTQTVVPVSVAHGSTFTVNIAMQNVGTATWGAGYSLVPIGSSAWGLSPISSGAVPPGGQQTFTANCTAPATPGTYTFQMRMDPNGTKFGQATKLVTVTVT